MRLARIREGDLVLVDDGIPYIAVVYGKEGRRLLVAPVAGHHRPGPVSGRQIAAHWRLTEGTARELVRRARDRQVTGALYPSRDTARVA